MSDEFKRGAVIALSTLQAMHDQPSMYIDVFETLEISKADLKRMDLSEYDKKNIAEIFAMSKVTHKGTKNGK